MKLTILCDSIFSQYVFKDETGASKYLQCEVKIVRAGTTTSYKAAFENILEQDVVVVSSLLNQVSNLENLWNGEMFDDEKLTQVLELVRDMTIPINEFAKKNSTTRVAVIPPMIRTSPAWLTEILEEIHEEYKKSLDDLVTLWEKPPIELNDLGRDGVHLITKAYGKLKPYLKNSLVNLKSNEQRASTSDDTRKRARTQDGDDDETDGLSSKEILLKLLAQNKEFLEKSMAVESSIRGWKRE